MHFNEKNHFKYMCTDFILTVYYLTEKKVLNIKFRLSYVSLSTIFLFFSRFFLRIIYLYLFVICSFIQRLAQFKNYSKILIW